MLGDETRRICSLASTDFRMSTSVSPRHPDGIDRREGRIVSMTIQSLRIPMRVFYEVIIEFFQSEQK